MPKDIRGSMFKIGFDLQQTEEFLALAPPNSDDVRIQIPISLDNKIIRVNVYDQMVWDGLDYDVKVGLVKDPTKREYELVDEIQVFMGKSFEFAGYRVRVAPFEYKATLTPQIEVAVPTVDPYFWYTIESMRSNGCPCEKIDWILQQIKEEHGITLPDKRYKEYANSSLTGDIAKWAQFVSDNFPK